MKLLKCKNCKGSGQEVCPCSGHMCDGKRRCGECAGKGKVLSLKDKRLKKKLQMLLEYK